MQLITKKEEKSLERFMNLVPRWLSTEGEREMMAAEMRLFVRIDDFKIGSHSIYECKVHWYRFTAKTKLRILNGTSVKGKTCGGWRDYKHEHLLFRWPWAQFSIQHVDSPPLSHSSPSFAEARPQKNALVSVYFSSRVFVNDSKWNDSI